jgi:hypothetical protein
MRCLRIGYSDLVVEPGDRGLSGRRDRPQSTRESLGWSITGDIGGECWTKVKMRGMRVYSSSGRSGGHQLAWGKRMTGSGGRKGC